MSLVHDLIDPRQVTSDHLRSARTDVAVLREQGLNVVDTVSQAVVLGNGLLENALEAHLIGLGGTNNLVHIGMRQNVLGVLLVSIKHVVLHFGISSLGIIIIFVFIGLVGVESLSHKTIKNRFLFIVHRIDDIINGFIVAGVLGLFLFLFSHVIILLLLVGMLDNVFALGLLIFTVA